MPEDSALRIHDHIPPAGGADRGQPLDGFGLVKLDAEALRSLDYAP
jgi:hypothetical protein